MGSACSTWACVGFRCVFPLTIKNMNLRVDSIPGPLIKYSDEDLDLILHRGPPPAPQRRMGQTQRTNKVYSLNIRVFWKRKEINTPENSFGIRGFISTYLGRL